MPVINYAQKINSSFVSVKKLKQYRISQKLFMEEKEEI
jgi:hypothetical protein